MKTAVGPTQPRLQASLLRQIKAGEAVPIREHNKTIAFLIPAAPLETLLDKLETLELLSNPKAMTALRDAKAGKTRYRPLSVLDEDDAR